MKYDGWLKIGTKLETKDFEAQIDYIESQMKEIEYKLKQADMGFEVGDTIKLEAQYEKLNNQLGKLKQQQMDLNRADLTNLEKQIKNASKETSNIINKIGKWALGVFAIQSAYGFVRKMISTVSQYNEKIAKDIEYMQFAIASGLQPIIEKIVSWVYKLLQYVNYIANAWFGVNLFANASADAMNKSAKSAKDMKKSLAGFDEMNIASSSNSTTTSSPSMDLSSIQRNVPEWIKWIGNNKELVISALSGIAIGLLAVKLGLDGIIGLGIGLIVAGLVLAIQGIVNFIKDPSWENFLTILQGIALVVAGIAVLMGGWIVALVALGVAIVAYVIQNWDKVKEILSVVGQWIYDNVILPIWNFIQGLWDTVVTSVKNFINIVGAIFTTITNLITNPFVVAKDTILEIFNGIKTFFKGFAQVIKSLFNGDIKGVLNGFKTMFKGIMDSLWSIAKAPINLIIGGLNALIKGINKISFDAPDWVPVIGGKKWGFNIKEIPKLKSGGIVNLPGKGIPIGVGRAIGGESGQEGVLPLTDSQAMEELGYQIGKNVVINLTNVTQLDGRTIERKQSKVRANADFAMNR